MSVSGSARVPAPSLHPPSGACSACWPTRSPCHWQLATRIPFRLKRRDPPLTLPLEHTCPTQTAALTRLTGSARPDAAFMVPRDGAQPPAAMLLLLPWSTTCCCHPPPPPSRAHHCPAAAPALLHQDGGAVGTRQKLMCPVGGLTLRQETSLPPWAGEREGSWILCRCFSAYLGARGGVGGPEQGEVDKLLEQFSTPIGPSCLVL